MFDLILAIPSVTTSITARNLPLFQCTAIAFRIFVVSFLLSTCAVSVCSVVKYLVYCM